MDATDYFLPAGCDLLDCCGVCTDHLAPRFSAQAEAQPCAAAYLFSLAECSLRDAKALEDVRRAQHVAVEALHLLDGQGRPFAARLLVHGFRLAAAMGGDGLAAQHFASEELRRAQLFGDQLAEACMLLSLAELSCDARRCEEALHLAESARRSFLSDATGLALVELTVSRIRLRRQQYHLAAPLAERLRGSAAGAMVSAAALRMQGRWQAAISRCKEALALAQEAGDERLRAALFYILASSYHEKGGRFREASMAAQEAMRLYLEQPMLRRFGWAEFSLQVRVKALLAETSRDEAREALTAHMVEARVAAGPRLLMRYFWVRLLKQLDGPGDREKAFAVCEKSLVALEHLKMDECRARELEVMCGLHLKANTRKTVEEAKTWAVQAQELLQQSALPYAEAEAIPSLANCHVLLGEPASEVLNRRRQLLRDLGARQKEAEALLDLAEHLCKEQISRVDSRARRFLRDAYQTCQDALNAFGDVSDEHGTARAQLLLADIYLYRQEPLEAVEAARQAQRLYRQEARLLARATRKVGYALCEADRPEEAAREASQAVVLCRKQGDGYALAEMLSWEAQMHSQAVGKQIEGLSEKESSKIVFRCLSKLMTPAKEAILLARKLQDKQLIASTLCSVAEVEASVGKWDAALSASAEAAALAERLAEKGTECRALVLSSEIHFRKKELDVAREQAERAWSLVKRSFLWDQRRQAMRALRRVGAQLYDGE